MTVFIEGCTEPTRNQVPTHHLRNQYLEPNPRPYSASSAPVPVGTNPLHQEDRSIALFHNRPAVSIIGEAERGQNWAMEQQHPLLPYPILPPGSGSPTQTSLTPCLLDGRHRVEGNHWCHCGNLLGKGGNAPLPQPSPFWCYGHQVVQDWAATLLCEPEFV